VGAPPVNLRPTPPNATIEEIVRRRAEWLATGLLEQLRGLGFYKDPRCGGRDPFVDDFGVLVPWSRVTAGDETLVYQADLAVTPCRHRLALFTSSDSGPALWAEGQPAPDWLARAMATLVQRNR
jgi:hypothetical protein